MLDNQLTLSDALLGLIKKREGQDLVEANNKKWVEDARKIAAQIASEMGCVTVDDVRKWADKASYYPAHPNAWGTIFKGKEWRSVGFTQSSVVSNHSRTIRIWRHNGSDTAN